MNSFLQPLRGILKSGLTKVRSAATVDIAIKYITASFLHFSADLNVDVLDRSVRHRMEFEKAYDA